MGNPDREWDGRYILTARQSHEVVETLQESLTVAFREHSWTDEQKRFFDDTFAVTLNAMESRIEDALEDDILIVEK